MHSHCEINETATRMHNQSGLSEMVRGVHTWCSSCLIGLERLAFTKTFIPTLQLFRSIGLEELLSKIRKGEKYSLPPLWRPCPLLLLCKWFGNRVCVHQGRCYMHRYRWLLLSVPSRLNPAVVLWSSFFRLAGFIHHSRQVYTPQPKARTANKLP